MSTSVETNGEEFNIQAFEAGIHEAKQGNSLHNLFKIRANELLYIPADLVEKAVALGHCKLILK